MTEDDKKMFEILDQLPRKLNVRSILKLYLSSHRWVDLYGMFGFYTVMVSVFNSAEFVRFLAGIMAQRGPAFLDRLKKIKEVREAIEKVAGEGSAPVSYPDQVSPPPDAEKRKRKEKKEKPKEDKKGRDKKASSSQPSPKRSRLSAPDTSKELEETDKGIVKSLFAADLNFAKGANMSLPSAERKTLSGSSTVELVNTCLEMHSRTLKVLRAHVLKGGVAELVKIKEELSVSMASLKESRAANAVLGEVLRVAELNLKKVEQERDALRAYSEGVKKNNEKLLVDVRELEQSLFEATLAHDEAVSEKAQMEIELNELKDYVLDLHKESFGQAVRQVIFLYGVLEQNDMDSDKDVFNGRPVPISEIPTVADDAAPARGDEGDNAAEGDAVEGGEGMRMLPRMKTSRLLLMFFFVGLYMDFFCIVAIGSSFLMVDPMV